MICPRDCSCLLCQLAAPAEIGCSSRVADASPLDDGCRRVMTAEKAHAELRAKRQKYAAAMLDHEQSLEGTIRRVNLKPRRKVVQTGRRKPR